MLQTKLNLIFSALQWFMSAASKRNTTITTIIRFFWKRSRTRGWAFYRVYNYYAGYSIDFLHFTTIVTLTQSFWPENHTICRLSQDYSILAYQVWTLWNHSFLSYVRTDKQHHRQTRMIVILIRLYRRQRLRLWVETETKNKPEKNNVKLKTALIIARAVHVVYISL